MLMASGVGCSKVKFVLYASRLLLLGFAVLATLVRRRIPSFLLSSDYAIASFPLLHQIAHDKDHRQVARVGHRIVHLLADAPSFLGLLTGTSCEPRWLGVRELVDADLVEEVRRNVVYVGHLVLLLLLVLMFVWLLHHTRLVLLPVVPRQLLKRLLAYPALAS